MVTWKRQGSAVIGVLKLLDGRNANAVIVGPASNPKGVSILIPKGEGADTAPLSEMLDAFRPEHIIDVLCMQETALDVFRDLGCTVEEVWKRPRNWNRKRASGASLGSGRAFEELVCLRQVK